MRAGWAYAQRCIHNSAFTKLRHDGIEMLLHDIIRDGVGLAYRQQHGLPAAERTVPDLLIYLDNQAFLCDVTVAESCIAEESANPRQLGL